MGGLVKDVIVHHKVYGEIKKDLNCSSRRDVKIFLEKMDEEKSKPLDVLTGGVHYHTVVAENEEVMEEIEVVLGEMGFLIED